MRASADTFSKEEHHIIVDNVKVVTLSAGTLAPALSVSVKTFGDDNNLRYNTKNYLLCPSN